jgi:hypothetical protein
MIERRTNAQYAIWKAARTAQDLASPAPLHEEPEEAASFKQITNDAEARAGRLANLQSTVISTSHRR